MVSVCLLPSAKGLVLRPRRWWLQLGLFAQVGPVSPSLLLSISSLGNPSHADTLRKRRKVSVTNIFPEIIILCYILPCMANLAENIIGEVNGMTSLVLPQLRELSPSLPIAEKCRAIIQAGCSYNCCAPFLMSNYNANVFSFKSIEFFT